MEGWHLIVYKIILITSMKKNRFVSYHRTWKHSFLQFTYFVDTYIANGDFSTHEKN